MITAAVSRHKKLWHQNSPTGESQLSAQLVANDTSQDSRRKNWGFFEDHRNLSSYVLELSNWI